MVPFEIKKLPSLRLLQGSLQLVKVLDKIRFGPLDDDENYGEFTWFIREYPRIYRHHIEHAEYRLRLIHRAYEYFHSEANARLKQEGNLNLRSVSISERDELSGNNAYAIYWNFESYLNAISAALDVLTRVVGTAYKQDTPPNFNRFCKTAPPSELKDLFCHAQLRWVLRMKAYRDCFVHFTAVDTILFIGAHRYENEWQIRAKIPTNPQAREIMAFRYSRRVELLNYSVTLWGHLTAFDKAVSKIIWRKYKKKEYPQKSERLFTIGKSKASRE